MSDQRLLTPAQADKEQLRKRVLEMYDQDMGYGCIGKKLGMSKSTVADIVKRFSERDSFADLPRKGRPTVVNDRFVVFRLC